MRWGWGVFIQDSLKGRWAGFQLLLQPQGLSGTYCFCSQVQYFVLQMSPGSSHSEHPGWGGGFHTSEGKPKHPLLFLWCTKSLVRLWLLFLPKNWMVTLSICSIHHVQDHIWARLFLFLCFALCFTLSHALPLILFLISCSVFPMSALLRTNQRLYFTNVTLSRLCYGCGDNEGL